MPDWVWIILISSPIWFSTLFLMYVLFLGWLRLRDRTEQQRKEERMVNLILEDWGRTLDKDLTWEDK